MKSDIVGLNVFDLTPLKAYNASFFLGVDYLNCCCRSDKRSLAIAVIEAADFFSFALSGTLWDDWLFVFSRDRCGRVWHCCVAVADLLTSSDAGDLGFRSSEGEGGHGSRLYGVGSCRAVGCE